MSVIEFICETGCLLLSKDLKNSTELKTNMKVQIDLQNVNARAAISKLPVNQYLIAKYKAYDGKCGSVISGAPTWNQSKAGIWYVNIKIENEMIVVPETILVYTDSTGNKTIEWYVDTNTIPQFDGPSGNDGDSASDSGIADMIISATDSSIEDIIISSSDSSIQDIIISSTDSDSATNANQSSNVGISSSDSDESDYFNANGLNSEVCP